MRERERERERERLRKRRLKKGNEERKEGSGSKCKGEEVLREEREILAHAPFPHGLTKPKNNLSSETYETFK